MWFFGQNKAFIKFNRMDIGVSSSTNLFWFDKMDFRVKPRIYIIAFSHLTVEMIYNYHPCVKPMGLHTWMPEHEHSSVKINYFPFYTFLKTFLKNDMNQSLNLFLSNWKHYMWAESFRWKLSCVPTKLHHELIYSNQLMNF